jgi:hypothetical protein
MFGFDHVQTADAGGRTLAALAPGTAEYPLESGEKQIRARNA